jgi:release factor glutamine methyltransferase
VFEGDLFEGAPVSWKGTVDVIIGSLPYVPTGQIVFLPSDVRTFEPISALDGGDDGLVLVRRAVHETRQWLRPGGSVLFEIGGDQPELLVPMLELEGFGRIRIMWDADGDARGIEAVLVP